MEAAAFPQCNVVLDPPPGVPLDVCHVMQVCRTQTVAGYPVVISCWKLTDAEWTEVQKTGRIWLSAMGSTMPPVALSGFNPFEHRRELNDEPDEEGAEGPGL